MQAYRIETTVEAGGSLKLDALPFPVGERVEVIVLPVNRSADVAKRYPLQGTPYRYDDPTAPVAEDDWEAAR